MCLLFIDRHAALVACVSPLTVVRLVVHYVHSLHLGVTVDARYHYVRTCSLVQVNVFPECLGAALVKGLALNGLVVAELIMRLHLGVAELHLTSKVAILALEFHLQ